MTKKKPKAYRGVQSYLTEEQISVSQKFDSGSRNGYFQSG